MIRLFSRLFHREKEAHPFCSAIVAAAGSSRRMGEVNKLMAPLLDGVPVLAWTLRALNEAELVDEIVVAVREEDLLSTGDLCKIYGISKPVKIVRGGDTRLDSVLAASLECREDAAFLAVHDGARPLASPALIDRTIALAHRTNPARVPPHNRRRARRAGEGHCQAGPGRRGGEHPPQGGSAGGADPPGLRGQPPPGGPPGRP